MDLKFEWNDNVLIIKEKNLGRSKAKSIRQCKEHGEWEMHSTLVLIVVHNKHFLDNVKYFSFTSHRHSLTNFTFLTFFDAFMLKGKYVK